jgi:nucleotide-binding universal stress UspA family protein
VTTILLPLFEDPAAETRLRAAVALAQHSGGHVVALQITPLEAYASAELWGAPLMMAEVIASVEQLEAGIRTRTEARLAREAIGWSYETAAGDFTRVICARARLADVVILPCAARGRGAGAAALPLAGDVAIHGQTPVLAVPPDLDSFAPGGPALVAWNGSGEAAEALRAALPLLARAARVTLLVIREEGEPPYPASMALDWLARHGVSAEVRELERAGTVGETLCAAATDMGAAWIAMGAWGHSRAREFLLGGVTRHMLGHAPVPLLLAR